MALGAVGQAKVTETQILGKWKGKYQVDVSKAPPERKAQAEQFKKAIEAATFALELKKDHGASVVTTGAPGNANGTLEGTWKLIGSDLEIKSTKFNGKVIPAEKQKSVNFRVMKIEKATMTLMMISRNAPPTTLALKKV